MNDGAKMAKPRENIGTLVDDVLGAINNAKDEVRGLRSKLEPVMFAVPDTGASGELKKKDRPSSPTARGLRRALHELRELQDMIARISDRLDVGPVGGDEPMPEEG